MGKQAPGGYMTCLKLHQNGLVWTLLILCPKSCLLEKDISNQGTALGNLGHIKIPCNPIFLQELEDELMCFECSVKKKSCHGSTE